MLGIYLKVQSSIMKRIKEISVKVIHSDGSMVSYIYTSNAEYLSDVLLDEGLAQGNQGEYGFFICTVDGEDAIYEKNGAY